jgi:hypothetical protein
VTVDPNSLTTKSKKWLKTRAMVGYGKACDKLDRCTRMSQQINFMETRERKEYPHYHKMVESNGLGDKTCKALEPHMIEFDQYSFLKSKFALKLQLRRRPSLVPILKPVERLKYAIQLFSDYVELPGRPPSITSFLSSHHAGREAEVSRPASEIFHPP